jgi:PAS domain S-box-containing protein
MEITRKAKFRLPAAAVQFLLGIGGLASITFVCFKLGFQVERTAFAYLILIALVSLLGSFGSSVVLSLIAVACLNYFFVPPLFDFRVDDPEDIARIAALLTTSLLVTALISRLRANEARFRTFVDHATDAFYLLDDRSTVLDVNRHACDSLGYSREELIGTHRGHFDVGLDDASIQRLKHRILAGEAITFETRHLRKDGTTFPVEIRVTQFEQGGRRFLCLARDITERKRAEDELRDSEERFRTVVQFSFDVYWESDAQHRFTRQVFSEGLADAPAPGSEIGKTRWEVPYLEPDAEGWRKHREMMDAHLPFRDFELARPTPDGGKRYVSVSGMPVFDKSGRFIGYRGVGRHITDRKLIELSLRQRERELCEILETIPAMTVTVLPDGSDVVIGKRFSAYSGLSEEQAQGSGWKASIHPDDLELHVGKWRAALKSGEPVEIETRFRRADGEYRWFLARAAPLPDEAGNILKWYEVLTDIEDRKQAEQALRASQTKLEAAQRIAHVGWWERDFSTGQVSLSEEVCRIFGVQPLELPQWHERWLKLIHPEDRPRAADAAAAALLPNGPRYDVEYRVVRPDGDVRIIHSQGDVTWDEAGRPLRQFGVLQDITDLRRAEKELRDSEERFRTLIQFSFDLYWETDAQHRFIRQDISERVTNGPLPGAELGKTRWELPYLGIDEDGWRKHREMLDAHLPFRDLEYARPTPDGGKRWATVSGLPLFDNHGQFIGYRGIARHITDRKTAEEALQRSEAYLAEAQRLSHTGTVAFNASAPIYWSQESYRIWGLDPLQGLPDRETVLQRIHPDDRQRVNAETEEAVRQKRDFVIEFRIVLPNGTLKYIAATGHPLFSADGELVEMVATHVDVTERKRAQEEHERLRQLESDLAHLNRVSMMGELAASLSHEILHPIATARNNARAGMRFLERSPPNLDEVREALACIVRDADRAKDIVGRMRDHIKKAPPHREPFDLNEAINEVIVTVRSTIANNKVPVRTRLMELPPVLGDRVQLQQVVMNLILNAVEAMSSIEEGAREVSIETEQSKTGGVLVAVRDSGPGIDPQHLERVFEPFYTTKTSGMGMGLSICRSIIAAHGGRLWAEANRPRGTIFQFTAPAGLDDS